MGTSNAYGGPNGSTPLVPSWIGQGQPPGEDHPPDPAPPPPIPQPGDPERFRIARSNYTRFARSGGRDRTSLGRAISNYVSSSLGGAQRASQRMGASRTASANLAGFLNTVSNQGINQTLRVLNLDRLVGRSIEEIFIGLVDYICPDGGTIDGGIAREAFIETIAELAENGITSFDGMTSEQIQTVLELYATHSIEARLCNDIGSKTIILPADIREVTNVQAQLHDFIRRGVADSLNHARTNVQLLTIDQVQHFVDQVYETAFTILQALGEAEGA